MNTIIAEHNGQGLWRYVVLSNNGAVVRKSTYKYESDLEAKYAGKKYI